MKRKILSLILCVCIFSCLFPFTSSFADISTVLQSDSNSIKISGTSNIDNVMLYLLRPNKTVADIETAFLSGNLSDTIVHYRQLTVSGGKYEYTITMPETEVSGEYLLCVGNESSIVYYAPMADRLDIAIQIGLAINKSMTFDIIDENKNYLGMNITIYNALHNKNIVGDLTYEELKGVVLDENDENSLEIVISKVNKSILIAALNEGLISSADEITFSTDSTELNNILELKDNINLTGKNVLVSNLSKKNFSEHATFLNNLNTQIVLQAINHPLQKDAEFLLNVLNDYYDILSLDLTSFNSLTRAKKATAVNKLSESNCTIDSIVKTFKKIVDSLVTVPNGPTPPAKKNAIDGNGMKVILSGNEKNEIVTVPNMFSDLSGYEWATEAVESLAKKSVISGYPGGLFMPEKNISRAEFIKIVVQSLYKVSSEYEQVFDDVSTDSWAFVYIMSAFENKIVNGVDERHFNPDSSITREDMAKILFNIIEDNDDAIADNPELFNDDAQIADYAKTAVYGLKAAGIINGMSDNSFLPKTLASRVEAAQLIYNFVNSKYAETLIKKQINDDTKKPITNKREDVLNLLVSMDVIDGLFDFNYDSTIKRGYFAHIAAAIKGIPSSYDVTGEIFSDVPLSNEYVEAIEFLAQMGAIDSKVDFRPNKPITLSEAIVILLRITDYSYFAEELGGYPNGYFAVAARKNLLSKIECGYNEELHGSDLLSLLYNTLQLNVVNFKSQNIYEENTSLTILESWHNVFSQKGVIIANSLTTYYSASDLPENTIQIEDNGKYINIDCGKTDIENEIGHYVTVYYKHDDNLGKSVCMFYEKDDKANGIIKISLEDLNSISDSAVSYFKDETGKEITFKLDINRAVIYNATYYTDEPLSMELINNKYGELCLIDNNRDGKYDVLKIVAYETYVVSNILNKGSFIYNKYDSNQSVNVDKANYDKYSLVFSDGQEAVKEDLINGAVMSISVNSPSCEKRVISMIVSESKISGVITELEKKGEKTTVTLDYSGKYNVYRKAQNNLPDVGNGIIAYLDAFSNIAYISNNNPGAFQYGLVIKSQKENDLLGEISMKIYGSSLKTEIYTVAQKIVIDGTRYKNNDDAYTAILGIENVVIDGNPLPNGVFPVRYILNEDNEISELDTPTRGINEGQNSFTLLRSENGVYSSDEMLGYTVPVDSSVVHIRLNTTDISDIEFFEDDKFLMYQGFDSLKRSTTYRYAAYNTDSSSPKANFLLTYVGYGMSYNHTFFTVNRIFDAYDAATNQILTCLEGVESGKLTKYKVAPKFESSFRSYNLVQGDVIRVDTNIHKQIVYIDNPSPKAILKYDKLNKKVTFNNIMHGTTDLSNIKTADISTHIFNGYVRSREEGTIEYVYASSGDTLTTDIRPNNINWDDESNILRATIYSGTTVTVYDASEPEDHRVYVGTYDDIADYVHNGEGYSRVLLRYRGSELKEIVVFNDAALMD